jgi:hypothetical protein
MGLTTDHGRSKNRRRGTKGSYDPPDAEGPPTTGRARDRGQDLDTDAGPDPDLDEDGGRAGAPLLGPLALQRALREVEATVDSEHVRLQGLLDEFREGEEVLQDRLEQLYLELGSIQDSLVENSRALRSALEERSTLDQRRGAMQAKAIRRTMTQEAAELVERAAAWASRQATAEARVRAFKDNPDLAEQITDFRRLDERLDTLELLPESYRAMVKQKHTELKDRLRPHLEEPKHEELKPLRLAVAVGVASSGHGEEERPGRLLAVLPVDFSTHQRAREGKGDLTARFAFRVLAALSRFVVNIGARTDPKPFELGGLLGIELPFSDLDLPLSPLDLARALRDSFAGAHDTQMAKVNVFTEMVFVSIGALETLWAEAQAPPPPNPRRKSRKKS